MALSKAREFGFTHRRLCLDRQPGQQRGRQRRRRRAGKLHLRAQPIWKPAKILGTSVYGANVIGVNGTYDQVNRLCTQVAFKYGWGFVNINLRPFYAEGSKTMGFEIAEQLGWRVPQHVVVPDGRRQPDRQDPQGVSANCTRSA